MLDKAYLICDEIANRGIEEVILFHSASGKDSIALLDIMASRFKRIVCVFMYIIKDMGHINRYINYAKKKYPNCEFVQVPHYAVLSYWKYGFMGHQTNPKQRLYNLSEITEKVREKLGIEWCFFGFKQSDSLNRRLMLRSYVPRNGNYELEAINNVNRKCYPLSHYKNADVLDYICRKGLVKPESYNGLGQSSGQNIISLPYLLFLRERYPSDLDKLCGEYPDCKRLLFEYDYKNKKKNEESKDTGAE